MLQLSLTETNDPAARWLPTKAKAVRIAAWYFALSSLWLLFAGWLLHHWVRDPADEVWLVNVRAGLFVVATAGLLGAALNRYFRQIRLFGLQLADNERRLRALGDHLPNSYVFQYAPWPDGRPRFTYISVGAGRIHGVKPGDILRDGGCVFAQMDPAQQAAGAAAQAASARDLTDFQMEARIRRPDGTERLLRLEARPHRSAGGQTVWDGVAVDITDSKKAEEALRRSEMKFARAFADNPAAIALTRLHDGVVLEVNDTWVALTGFAREEIIGQSARFMWPEPAALERFVRELRDHGVIRNWEQEFRNKAGETYVVALAAQVMDLENDTLILSTLLDISVRKRAEAALRESEARHRSLFRDNHAVMWLVDPRNGRIVDANPAAARFYGWTVEELRHMNVADINVLASEKIEAEMRRAQSDPGSHFFFQHRLANGSIRDVEVFSGPITLDGHERLYSIIHDITERERAEARLETLNQCLVSFGPDPEENIAHLSALLGEQLQADCAIYSRLAGEQLRAVAQWRAPADFCQPNGLHDRLCHDIVRSGEAKPRVIFDLPNSRYAQGDAAAAHGLKTCVAYAILVEGVCVGALCVFFRHERPPTADDLNLLGIVSSAVGVEEKRQRLEAQYHQAQKLEAIGQLAGGVAHDFNNILTSILMQTELSDTAPGLADELREAFAQIRSDADRAAGLTRQLLLFSRRQVMQSRDVDLNEIVTHLTKMLQRIIGEDIRLQLNLHLAPLMTHADPGMLEQVVMNLAVNARDAMPAGGQVVLETFEQTVDEEMAWQQPDAVPGRYVCLRVTDTGCGIPADILPHIFEPFFTTKEAGKGTGLGLATVFGIVKQHRGWLKVDSRPGAGTVFSIFLHANVPSPAAAPAVRARPRGGTETLLLVEDEPSVRRATVRLLAKHGYHVLEAASGPDALKVWAEHQQSIALLFTDLVMPGGMSGRQLALALQVGRPGLKVVFASGYSEEIAGQEIQLRPHENFVQKPFLPDDLLATIRGCLDR